MHLKQPTMDTVTSDTNTPQTHTGQQKPPIHLVDEVLETKCISC